MKNLNLRLPDPLHQRVKDHAERDDRSLNSEVLWLLKLAMDVRDTRPAAKGAQR
jgi:predicted HicB family RNase H-like nuclease